MAAPQPNDDSLTDELDEAAEEIEEEIEEVRSRYEDAELLSAGLGAVILILYVEGSLQDPQFLTIGLGLITGAVSLDELTTRLEQRRRKK